MSNDSGMVRVGVVSLSHMHAYAYLQALQQLPAATVIGIFDEARERGEAAAQCNATSFYDRLEPLLSRVDAVIICAENRLHYEYARAAALAGVHILLEKPLTVTGEQGRELIELCRRQGVWLQTAFPVRMHTAVQRMKQQVARGDIGDIVAVAATNRSKIPDGWFVDPERAGGGATLDHTVHVTDVLRWLLRSEVAEVYAEIDTLLHEVPVDDCGLLSMKFANGVIATLDTSWSRPPTFPLWAEVSMRIIGTKGALHLDVHAQAAQLWGDDRDMPHQYVRWGDNANQLLVAEFIQAVADNRAPLISGEDGLRAAEVAWAAYASAQSGQPQAVIHY